MRDGAPQGKLTCFHLLKIEWWIVPPGKGTVVYFYSHNIYVVGILFFRPWAPFAVWLEIEFPHPPVPPGPRCCYYFYCWLFPAPKHYWFFPSPEFISHSAKNSIADFERPLLAPQTTDFHVKKASTQMKGCSTTWNHQNVNLGTLFFNKKRAGNKAYIVFFNNKNVAEGRSHVEP